LIFVVGLSLLCVALTPDRERAFGFAPMDVPGIDDSDRLAAMLSIHAHAWWPDADERKAQVIDLDDSVAILQRDVAPAASSRRRRAVAKLATHGFEVQRGEPPRLVRFRKPIISLGADPLYLEKHAASLDPSLFFEPHQLESIILDWLVYFTPSCPWLGQKPEGAVKDPPPMGWNYSVVVPRHVSDIARAFDPQKWDECSTFFPETYRPVVGQSCCPYSGDTTTDCSFTPDGEGRPPVDQPRAAGRPTPWSPLYENYCSDQTKECGSCLDHDCDLEFRNLMCVKSEYDISPLFHWATAWADSYTVHYKLASWLRSETLGQEQNASDHPDSVKKITSDEGWVKVVATPPPTIVGSQADWSKVTVEKGLRFNADSVTQEYGQLLKIFQEEIAGQIAEQACCMLDVEPWGPWWWWWKPKLIASIDGEIPDGL
jgi:hypothetical protein